MVVQSANAFKLDELVIGVTSGDTLFDDRGVMLIAEGVEITETLIANLRRRGIKTLHRQKVVETPVPSAARRQKSPPRKERVDPPVLHGISPNYSAKKVRRIKERFDAGEKAISYLSQAVKRSSVADLRRTDAHVENYIDELVDDPDPVVANALAYESDLELAHRCVQLSVLSMAIAQQLEFSSSALRNLGSAALVHDWGLFDLPVQSRFPHQAMTDELRDVYNRHPITAVEMLNTIGEVAPDIKVFVVQVHELLNGEGFPRRLQANQLHPASRILCVADAYLTMTSPPKGFPRIVPCDAVAFLINGASQGKYSAKAVSALLNAVTLYPLGSIVELNDTTRARVIRSNGSDYGYPIVESLADTSRIINLKSSELFITRPIPSVEYGEVRLPETQQELTQAISGL